MLTCNRCKREVTERTESPLFRGEQICGDCWAAEEAAYIEVTRDLERVIDKTERWPMYWRVLAKVAEKPEEHIGIIKWSKERRERA